MFICCVYELGNIIKNMCLYLKFVSSYWNFSNKLCVFYIYIYIFLYMKHKKNILI